MEIKRTSQIVCLALLIVFSFCKKAEPSDFEFKLGYTPTADAAQIYIGIELGYFQQQGIHIQLVKFTDELKILEALGAGSINIGMSNYLPFVAARAAGMDFVAITGGAVENRDHRVHAYLVNKNSGITSVKHMRGKYFALNGLKNIEDLMFQELIEKYGVDRSKMRIVVIPFKRMESALQSQEVDIIATREPFVTRAIIQGNSRVLINNYTDLYQSVPIACYVGRESWIELNKEPTENFILAFNQATDFCIKNSDKVKTIIGKYTNVNEEELSHMGLPTFCNKTDPMQLHDLISRMLKRGLIRKELTAEDMIYK